ncbi:MAG: recombination protein RecR, partial [Microgenomates group bacterium]
MAGLPSNLKHIAYFLQRLPGIGEKTANRLAFYFLRLPQQELKELSENILQLKEKTKLCVDCKNLTEFDRCSICENPQRDKTQITVVEDVLDLLSFETGNIYSGVYHVL